MAGEADDTTNPIEDYTVLETEEIRAHVEQLLLDREKSDAEVAALQERHDEDTKTVEICNFKIKALEYEVDVLRRDRATETAAYHFTVEVNSQLVKENENLLTSFLVMQEKFEQQQRELAEVRAERDELRMVNAELNIIAKEHMEMKPKYLFLVEEEQRLRKALVICQAENSDLRRRLEATQQELAAALAENAELRRINEELTILAKELELLKPKYAALLERCDKLQRDLALCQQENAELRKQVEDLETQLEAAIRELRETKAAFAKFSAAAKEELERLRKENATYDAIVTAVRSEDARLRPCIFCAPAPRYVPEKAARADEARAAAAALRRARGELLDRLQDTEVEYQLNLAEHHSALAQLSFAPVPVPRPPAEP